MSTIKLKMADNDPPDLAHGNQGFTVDGTLSGLVISLKNMQMLMVGKIFCGWCIS